MKFVIPHTGELKEADARVMRLAEFLGITCERVFFERRHRDPGECLANTWSEHGSCLLVNPQVIKEWTGGLVPAGLVPCLTSRFPYLFIHALRAEDPFDQGLIRALSRHRLHYARRAGEAQLYDIATNSRDICGAFSGLSFGPVNPANDCVLPLNRHNADVRAPISIGGSPFMALIKRDNAEIVFLASADALDVNDNDISGTPLTEYFSRFVPHVMALRYIFGEQCWRPSGHYASFIIDDPLLRPRYGYLDFASLLNLMEEYNFSTTIAFIPHNYRRNSPSTVEMFRQSGGRLGICFHGNDHTAGEFASTDTSQLNTMLRIADRRMDSHTNATGLRCPKIMVFPQDTFSVQAMKILKSRNFSAAVCGTPHPDGCRVKLTIGEQAQPAILRHGNFPLFFRRSIGQLKTQDIASNLLYGQPVLVAEHHGLFRQVRSLVEDVLMINSIAPDIRWCDLETALLNSTLRRRTPDGVNHVRAYSSVVPIANNSDSPGRFVVEWSHSRECPPIEQVLQGGTPIQSFTVDDSTLRVSVELPPRSCETVFVVYQNEYSSLDGLGFVWHAKAFTRRRLSEMRDKYMSNNQFAMALGQTLKRRLFSKLV